MKKNTSKIKVINSLILSLFSLMIPLIVTLLTFYYSGSYDRKILTYFTLVIIIFLLLSLVNRKYIYLLLLLLSTILFSLLSFIDVAHYLIFNDTISSSTIYILLESNKTESAEFITTYLLRPKIIFIAILYLLSLIIGLIFSSLNFRYIKEIRKSFLFKRPMIFFGLIISLILLVTNRTHFLPYTTLNAYYKFKQEREEISKISIKKHGDFIDVQRDEYIKNEKETFVVVIGESTTRTHMGLYGYYRKTNPLLTKRKKDLFIFNNVRSPHTHTITSLISTLTLYDNHDEPSKKFNSTLIQLFNSANFNTYFISNQKPIGKYETTITLISKTSGKSIFTNVSRASYDGVVIKPLKQVLKEDSNKKFIIIHLMGTHLRYANRYPSNYNIFKDTPLTKFNHEIAYKTINQYDNGILYNDYIINSIIDELENDSSKSFMLYFSDHGEDVFETIDESCHSETKGTEPMYKIPFILWFSDDYLANKEKWCWDTERKYKNKNLLHTIADLSGLKFRRFDASKSIVNSNFKNK